jgi:hypothetical protein
MRIASARALAFAALFLGSQVFGGSSAKAQAFPPGSYQRSCTQIHWSGPTLVAECRKHDGGMTGTGLANAQRCASDIVNIDGQLQCSGSGTLPSRAPALPPSGYGQPQAPGYPPPSGYGQPSAPGNTPPSGYGQPPAPGYAPPGYAGSDTRCEELWHREQELRERLNYAPWGPDRDQLEYRLHDTHERRERLGCGR